MYFCAREFVDKNENPATFDGPLYVIHRVRYPSICAEWAVCAS